MASLSIKNVPDEVVEKLRQRAARHHRSLQGELMSIISNPPMSAAVFGEDDLQAQHLSGPADIDGIVAQLRATGYRSPDESTAMIREDRDLADGRR